MARNNYSGNYEANNIKTGVQIRASDMWDALNLMEKVRYREDTVSNSTDKYPSSAAVYAHTNSTSNPHSVTKTQVGLGNVDNTSDVNKPISTATQTALNNKQALLPVGTILLYDGTGWPKQPAARAMLGNATKKI